MQYYQQGGQGPLQYYQQSGTPGWGTSQFQFGAPPPVGYQPQSTWGGRDFYRAHAMDAADPALYDHAWNMVRDMRDYDSSGTVGVGMHEARHWHRQAYGGLGQVHMMQPAEIGHAAAYEAYRTWIHNRSMIEPIGPDIERQREALIGLAAGEAQRLFQYSNRPQDPYAREQAVECAAATASHIFYWSRERDEGDYFRGRSRFGGFQDLDDEPYAYDMHAMYPEPRSHSRHRSSSRHYPPPIGYAGSGGTGPPPIGYAGSGSGLPPPIGMNYGDGAPGMGLPYPGSATGMGYAGSASGLPPVSYAGSASGMMPGTAGMMPGAGGMMPGTAGMMPGAGGMMHGAGGMVPGAQPMYAGGVPYAGSVPMSYAQQQQYGVPMTQGQYAVSPTYGSPTIVSPGRHGSFSMPYMQQQYGVAGQAVAQYLPGQQPIMGMAQPSPTVIIKSHKKHRHRSSSRHRHRSRSVGVYDY